MKQDEIKPVAPLNIQVHQLTSMREEIETFGKIAQQTLLSVRPKYPLVKFTQYFAPIFLGFQEPMKGQNVYAAWQMEVGSLHTEVDVVNESDEIVFVVPPLMDTSAINLMQAEEASPTRFSRIEQIHEQNAKNFQEMARNSYYANVAQKLQNIFSFNRQNPQYLRMWLNIFAYYKVPTDFLLQKAREHLGDDAVNRATQTTEPSGQRLKDLGFDSDVVL